MIAIKRGAATVATVNPLSSSNMSKAVMGEEQITLVWEAPAFVSFSVNDYITVEGSNWTLNRLPTVKKLSSKLWQYNAVFQSTKYDLIKAMYLLFDNTETLPAGEFSLTGTADTFMELLVSNLNRVAGSTLWSVGDVVENTDYKNLTFSNEDCLSVISRLASEFDTEYHVANHTIHLKRISTVREVTLQYGSTLYDIERASVDSADVVTRLYPFGSTRNLASNYRGGNSPLRIPVANGNYIENNVGLYGVIERAMTFEDIYPRLSSGGAGVVTGVGNEFTFTDTALDFNVNDYLLDGTPAKVHFNTGECAGYDFEIASYNHSTKTFVIIANTQENDFTLPTATLKPAVNNKYVLLDIIMPPAYLTAAEAELLAKAQEYIGQNSTPKVSYKTTFSAIYAKQNLQSVECGDTVTVYDADMGIDEQIRIIKLQKGLTDFWTIQFDLANSVTATRLERIEGTVATVENTVVVANQRINRNNLRAYQNTKELQSMVFDPDGYFDAENIKPLSIETTMLSVGAKSQSFQLSSLLQPNYDGNPQVLAWGAGVLTHFTIVDDAIKEWVISEGSITITGGNQTAALYIYARCSRAGTTGDIYLSATATKFDADATYYFFLLGVLHTPISSVRGVSLTYGQTTINGQFIKTGVISSIDGATYFNLNTGEIGGTIKFKSGEEYKEVGAAIEATMQEGQGNNILPNCDFATDWSKDSTPPMEAGVNLDSTWSLGGNTNRNNNQGLNTAYLRHGPQNLFNKDTVTDGYYIADDVLVADAAFYTSALIPVVGGQTYTRTFVANKFYTWFDSNQQYIESGYVGATITAPNDAAYIRLSMRYTEAQPSAYMFVLGSTIPLVYTPFGGVETLGYVYSDNILPVVPGTKYMMSAYVGAHRCKLLTYLEFFDADNVWLGYSGEGVGAICDEEADGGKELAGYKRVYASVAAPSGAVRAQMVFRKYMTKPSYTDSYAFICRPMVEIVKTVSTLPGQWRPYTSSAEVAAFNYLKDALAGSTEIAGGLVGTNVILLKTLAGIITGGMSGLGDDNVGFWTGGTYAQAVADVASEFKAAKATGALDRKDGAGHRAKGNFAWDAVGNVFFKGVLEALSGGKIGNFSIVNGRIVGYVGTSERIILSTSAIPTSISGLAGSDVYLPIQIDLSFDESSVFYFPLIIGSNSNFTLPFATTLTTYENQYSLQMQGATLVSVSERFYFYSGNTLLGYAEAGDDFSINAAGTYRCEHRVTISANLDDAEYPANVQFDLSEGRSPSYTDSNAKTEIGNNGFYSYWSESQYIYFCPTVGFEVRFGSYIFQLTSTNGLRKSTNGGDTWSSL